MTSTEAEPRVEVVQILTHFPMNPKSSNDSVVKIKIKNKSLVMKTHYFKSNNASKLWDSRTKDAQNIVLNPMR